MCNFSGNLNAIFSFRKIQVNSKRPGIRAGPFDVWSVVCYMDTRSAISAIFAALSLVSPFTRE